MGEPTQYENLTNLYEIFKLTPSIITHRVTKAHKLAKPSSPIRVPDGDFRLESMQCAIAVGCVQPAQFSG